MKTQRIASCEIRVLVAVAVMLFVPFLAHAETLQVGPTSPYSTIQAAINAALPGDTIYVSPGIYNENIQIDKRLVLEGAGCGEDPAANTILRASTANLSVVRVTGSGWSPEERLVLRGFRISGGTGGGNTGSGIEIEGSGSTDYVTLSQLVITENEGHGIAIDHTGTMHDLLVTDCDILGNGSIGLSTPQSLGELNGLTVLNCRFEDNGSIGLWVETANSMNIWIEDTQFIGNAPGIPTCGDLILSPFNGDAVIKNVVVISEGADSGIRISGASAGSSPNTTAAAPAGSIRLENVTVEGAQVMAAIAISRYTDLASVEFIDVELASTAPVGLHLGTNGGSLSLGNSRFFGFYDREILLGTHRNSASYVPATVAVDATGVTFAGAATGFAVEDRVQHALDNANLGLVTWHTGRVYVTPSSGSIQRGINAVSEGGTVLVAPGTYVGALTIKESRTLRGPQAGVDARDRATDSADEAFIIGTVSVTALDSIVDGFTLGGETPPLKAVAGFMCYGDGAQILNNIIQNVTTGMFLHSPGERQTTIQHNVFRNILRDGYTGGCLGDAIYADNVNNHVLIDGNEFTDLGYSALILAVATHHDIVVSNNRILRVQQQAIQAAGTCDNVAFIGNYIEKANLIQAEDKGGIRIYGEQFVGPVVITDNTIVDCYNGFAVKDGQNISGKDIHVNGNNFVDNANAGIYHGGVGELDASCNWWGDPSGPSGIGMGSGDAVTSQVAYEPWMLGPAPDGACGIAVAIDIKPGSSDNSLQLKARGKLPVAILTTESFDARSVDPESVRLASAAATHWGLEDVDDDGDLDLMLHIIIQDLDLTADSTEATLTGSTTAGMQIVGMDAVRIVGKVAKKSELEDLIAVELQVLPCPNPVVDIHTTVFRAMGAGEQEAEALWVRIFDLSGHLVWESQEEGPEVVWHTENLDSVYLANGVYLYLALVRIEGVWQSIGGISTVVINR